MLTALQVVVSVGDGKGFVGSISKGLLGTESYHVLAGKAVVDTMVKILEVFTKLCDIIFFTGYLISMNTMGCSQLLS